MDFKDALQWRYATKRFDTEKKVDPELLDQLLDSIQLSASSFGLEPYQVLIIENNKIREELKEASWKQPQITEASHLLLFCVNPSIGEEEIDEFLKNSASTRNIPLEAFFDYKAMMLGHLNALTEEEREQWCTKQAYIALGFGLTGAATLGIDTCAMEGFDSEKYDEILSLKSWKSKVVLAIGFRSEKDKYQNLTKVRKPKSVLFKHL